MLVESSKYKNNWEALREEYKNSFISDKTYSKEKYPGWRNYRGGNLRPLSYDNPLNKYDDAIDTRDPVELAENRAAPAIGTFSTNQPLVKNFANTGNFGIAEPDMRYSPDVGRLSITLVFIERD